MFIGQVDTNLSNVGPAFADSALNIPGAERVGPRTIGFTVPDFLVGYKTFLVAAALPMMFIDPVF